MELPEIIRALINAQNTYNSDAFTKCFSETATVLDEGKKYIGRSEIRQWFEKANEKYKTVLNPIEYQDKESESMLMVDVSGTFEGSPIVMSYYLTLENGLIQSLRITG